MNEKHEHKMKLLERIVCHQILNVSFDSDLSVCKGRMGCIIFFYHYSRYTNNELFAQIADELLEELCEKIAVNANWYFSSGLAGIGWGIEYLARNKFIDGDTNEILYNIDKKIMEYDVYRIPDRTFEKGIEGLSWYVLSRLMSQHKVGRPFDDLYLKNMVNVCRDMTTSSENQGVLLLNRFFEGEKITYPYLDVLYRIIDYQKVESSCEDLTWQNGMRQLL